VIIMKVMTISGKPDFERFLRGFSHYSGWDVATRGLHLGSYEDALRFYEDFKPNLVVIDNCEGPATGRHDAIRRLEQDRGMPPATMQLINDYRFMEARS